MSHEVAEMMLQLFRRYREQVLDSHAASEMRKCEEEFIHSQCIPSPIPINTHTFTFCDEGITSPIDSYFDERHVFDRKLPKPIIDQMFWRSEIKLMANLILKEEDQSNLFTTAKVCMGDFLNLVEKDVPIPSACVKSLLHGVWIDPLFRRSLYEAMDSDSILISQFITYSTQDSVFERTKSMVADLYFSNPLKKLEYPTSKSTFLRLFLSILISYWTDDRMLRGLDLLKGEIIFSNRKDNRNAYKARIAKEEKEKLKLAGGGDGASKTVVG